MGQGTWKSGVLSVCDQCVRARWPRGEMNVRHDGPTGPKGCLVFSNPLSVIAAADARARLPHGVVCTVASRLSAFARFWEGEPPGEPRHHPARTEPRPG